MSGRLERLLRPKTIAVFGGKEAARVVEQCDRMGFAGGVWPVHPKREDMAGRRCYRSVEELPGAPNAVFVGVNRHLTIAIVRALAARGAGGAVCYASGFHEAGDAEGEALGRALIEAAGAMPILGPNCYGLINYLDGALLWPDQHGGIRSRSGVAIVTQSSNIAINMTMQRRGLPLAYVATAGNQAQLGLAEIAKGLIEDPRVTAIGLHVEGIGDVRQLEALAARARELRKPVVAIVVGRSDEARAATVSHTASIAGSETATAALFDRLGIARLRSIPEFLETLKLLHVHGPLPGGDLCSMSCSGGEASLMADAAVGRSVRFRKLSAEERARVKATLSDLVAVANPLDYHTFIWGDEAAMTATFAAMLGCGFDLSMLVLDFPRTDRCDDADWEIAIRALGNAKAETGGRTAVIASLPENLPEERARALVELGIAPLSGIEEALAAAEAAAAIGAAWARPVPTPLLAPGERARPLQTLSEAEAKTILKSAGIAVPAGILASTPCEAVRAADAIGYPVALKALGLAHKSEEGGVRLDLEDAAAVEAAADAMAGLGCGFLIERMVEGAVAELMVGIVREPRIGFVLTIGAGGVLCELSADTRSLLLPATADEIRAAILSLKTAPLFSGYRGRPVADVEAAVAVVAMLCAYVEAHAEELEEIEINPLILRGEGEGAVAADALVRRRGHA